MTIGKHHEDIRTDTTERRASHNVRRRRNTNRRWKMHEEYKKKNIGLACAAFWKVDKMWRTKSISLKTKMKLYWTLVLPVLICGSECCTLRKEDERRLLMAVEMVWLRRIRGRSRRERIRDEKTREELGAEKTVIEKTKRRRLTWFGHVERMEGKRLPHAALL